MSSRKPGIFSNATECLALLAYLTQDDDLNTPLEIYHAASSRLSTHKLSRTIFSETVEQAKAKLLYFHVTTGRKYKLSFMRDEFTSSISQFPQNTIFLSLFAWNERRFRIDDRVRAVARQHKSPAYQRSLDDDTDPLSTRSVLILHLFSIYTELHRGVSAGSTAYSARATFEAAVNSPSGQYSAALWKLYVLFELSQQQKQARPFSLARDVFYRGMRACPWAKELVLLAFREPGLRDTMSHDELHKVWNVLVEKELRIRVDLESWLEEQGLEANREERKGELPVIIPEDPGSGDDET